METKKTEKFIYEGAIKLALLKRFGATYDPKSNQIKTETEYNDIVLRNMGGNCNAVSRIILEVISGQVYELTATGNEPAIFYSDKGENSTRKIASGYTQAKHRFVIDPEGKVWDPILNKWGETDLEAHRGSFSFLNSSETALKPLEME